ncbi:F0F1 ATP synthase subunit B [Flavobacteriales bacterium]|jgi:F-type H+-transporting ATPase subunit b|nr:F0F1 ATP synthase subunit B [Flavobacteriales bacterium]
MDQLLNDFSPGLFFMQAIILLILILLMRKFAWKPVLSAISEREENISEAIELAEKTRADMAKMQSDNEALLQTAREERDEILKAARVAKESMIAEAKGEASAEAEKIIVSAKEQINNERKAALTDVKNQVAMISLEVAEKILRTELASNDKQKDLVGGLIDEVKLN